ncbi:SixA phosphatase family protein [Aquirufa rosea]|uniref:Phosphohistidine phosphatase n=1 Tax=Aquirufa rosea TaxID=2509241 RepID=A0A4Q1C0X5_9BACT|nr:histidine phosphatase family protein [Aquirufa rosea]RXK50704.1 hypothetical protein ESB04_03385 [Aquirufa rosea]
MIDLILIRHAHAGPYDQPDKERPLSLQGMEEVSLLAQKMKSVHLPSGLWLCSDAKRTLETATALRSELGIVGPINLDNCWYHASGPKYVDIIEAQNRPVIYLIAHNPSISYVASYYAGSLMQMETGGCCYLRFQYADSPAELSKGAGDLVFHFNPQIV